MRPLLAVLATLCSLTGQASANEITHGAIRVEAADGLGHLNEKRWALLRFDIRDFRMNGACYNGCRLRFTLDGHLPTDARAHIGITSGETVRSRFTPPAGNRGNPTGYAGAGPFPSDMNRQIETFAPDEKLAIAWIALNAAELIDYAAQNGQMAPAVATAWRNDAPRFERDVLKGLRKLRPFIRSMSQ